MDLELQDRHVFVAGASRGIGYAIAEGFLQEGARVSLTGRGAEALEAAYSTLSGRYGSDRVFRMAGDLTRTDVIVEALSRSEDFLGPIHTVVGNVGIDATPPGWDVDDVTFDIGFAQNFLGSYRLARESVRRVMARDQAQRDGFNIIFISSGAGEEALKTPLTYGGSKAILNHVTKELSKLLGKDGIRVNAVCPAMTVFAGNGWEQRLASEQRDYWIEYNKRETALQRFAAPQETADVVLFLASRRAGIVTGAIVAADAGQLK